LLQTTATYEESNTGGENGRITPRTIVRSTFTPVAGLSLNHTYVRRENQDDTKLITRGWQLNGTLGHGFTFSGAYQYNPLKPNSKDYEVQSRLRTHTWTLSGPVAPGLTASLDWSLSQNLTDQSWQKAAGLGLQANLKHQATLEVAMRFAHRSAEQGRLADNGMLVNYTQVLDDNHSLRLCLVDQPEKMDLFAGRQKAVSLADDAKISVEYKTSF